MKQQGKAAAAALTLLGGSLLGLLACVAALSVPSLGNRARLALVLGPALLLFALWSGRPRLVFLFAWVALLTYNRQFFSFDSVFGDYGSQGAYWIPADPALLALFVVWGLERRRRRAPSAPVGLPSWPLLLPYALVAIASSLAAAHPIWGAFELLRVIRFALVLYYVRRNFGRAELWTCVAAFAVVTLLQSGLATLQVVRNVGSGLTSLVGAQGPSDNSITVEFAGQEQVRGAGTMVHPNILAPYLLFLLPVFAALALTLSDRRWRTLAGATAAVGLVGVVSTMSRLPFALALLELIAVAVVLTRLRAVSVEKALGAAFAAAFVGTLILLPLAGKVQARLTADFRESIELRERYNRAALGIASRRPVLGVGLNNFRAYLAQEEPEFAQMLDEGEFARKQIGLRVAAPVHNFYLLVLSETGALGLLTFLLFLAGIIYRGFVAVARTEDKERAVVLGLVVGLLAQVLQQTMDYSLWADPSYYTLALITSLLKVATRGFGASGQGRPHAEPAPGHAAEAA